MEAIRRTEKSEEWADSHIVEAGNLVFIGYCMRYEGEPIDRQINGAFDVLSERLGSVGLTLESVVQMDCLFKDISDLTFLSDIVKERFGKEYPARKAYETNFIREDILFQVDAVAFKG